jgi:hypothetical protein
MAGEGKRKRGERRGGRGSTVVEAGFEKGPAGASEPEDKRRWEHGQDVLQRI